ncbi:MAG TPA: DUF5996 family protein [Candidatus Limnocylindria bacterium]|nr:DUF5996 family protein [Candidatus Limnocylindria bacterium]
MDSSGSPAADGTAEAWPELPWREWAPTISTLQLWTQVVGKLRLALTPPVAHWWQVPLYLTARGLTTSAIPYGHRRFQVDFDFVDHRLDVTDDRPGSFSMALALISVARFHRELMAALAERGFEVRISRRPVEVAEAIPFAEDEVHASYDAEHAHRFWRGLIEADRVFRVFRSRFVGKASPVQFFWGSFDLSATRYSGRAAPAHPGGAPNCPDWVMVEAESRENAAAGWWPLSEEPGPAFYAYAYPAPDGYRDARVGPAGARFDERRGEFLLPYDTVRTSADPDAAVLEFLQTTYEAAATLGGWDRAMLEATGAPQTPPHRPWSEPR